MANTQQTQVNKPVVPPTVSTPGNLSEAEIEKRLKLAQLIRLETENAKAEEERRQFEEALAIEKNRKIELARVQDAEKLREMASQESCMHTTEGRPIVAAIGVWNTHIPISMCQGCGKVWEGAYPPAHLIPKAEMIGRPQFS